MVDKWCPVFWVPTRVLYQGHNMTPKNGLGQKGPPSFGNPHHGECLRRLDGKSTSFCMRGSFQQSTREGGLRCPAWKRHKSFRTSRNKGTSEMTWSYLRHSRVSIAAGDSCTRTTSPDVQCSCDPGVHIHACEQWRLSVRDTSGIPAVTECLRESRYHGPRLGPNTVAHIGYSGGTG